MEPVCAVIVGASMAGLSAALCLKKTVHRIVILERDPAPPDITPERAFDVWQRPGVPQFRHAHMLLGRFRTELRDHHPELLAELCAAGLELSELTEVMPDTQLDSYAEEPGDDELRHLWGRRPTFEYVFRRHVERLPGVRFVHDARVTDMLSERSGGALLVTGVVAEVSGVTTRFEADLVVDASGKRSRFPGWLRSAGVPVKDTSHHASERMYACRHYRVSDDAPPRERKGVGINLDYFASVVFYAEHGNLAITMSCAEQEAELTRVMLRADGFERLCAEVPLLRTWLERAQPISKVFGSGKFVNRWTDFGGRPGLALRGYFPVGDVQIETNPVYGRGCASALLQARELAAAIAESSDPDARFAGYRRRVRQVMRPHFDFCVFSDWMFGSRARQSRGEPVSTRERLLHWAYDRLWTPALERSPVCGREMVRAMQMREMSPLPVRLVSAVHVILYGALALFRPRARPLLGPGRDQAPRSVRALVERPDPTPTATFDEVVETP